MRPSFLLRADVHNPQTLAVDPAITRYTNMQVNRYKYFRWTPRSGWINVVYVLVIPSTVGYIGWRMDGKYDFRGKRRNDTIVEW